MLVLLLTFSLVACGNEDNPDPLGSDNPGTSQTDNLSGEFSNWGDIFSNLGDPEGLAEQFRNGGLESLPIE